MQASKHPQEQVRLQKLQQLNLLDTPAEAAFDDIVELASRICEAPISLMSLVDGDRQWFKSEVGAGMNETGLEDSICAHTIIHSDFLEIGDLTKDSRTGDMPIVVGDPNVRFYAGAVLRHPTGTPLGALCVLDLKPRELSDFQRFALRTLRDQINMQLALRQALADLTLAQKETDHRVKNSLQLVGTMIRLQASRSTDDDVRSALASAMQRVESIAALHETIYKSKSALSVSAAELFAQATAMMQASVPVGVELKINMPDTLIPANMASSVLIAVSEFVTNACKHAFADSGKGEIHVDGKMSELRLIITCRDNGGGMDETRGRKGLGMRIIDASIQKLGNDSHWSSSAKGTTLRFSAPISLP